MVCAGFELVRPCLLGPCLSARKFKGRSGVDGCPCLTQNRISHQLCYQITWWGKFLWQEATSSPRLLPSSSSPPWWISLQGGSCHPLCSGGRGTSPLRRCSGFINTKFMHPSLPSFEPSFINFNHFSLAVKQVCDSQSPSERCGVLWRPEKGLKPFLTGRHPLPAKVDSCPCSRAPILDPISLFFAVGSQNASPGLRMPSERCVLKWWALVRGSTAVPTMCLKF